MQKILNLIPVKLKPREKEYYVSNKELYDAYDKWYKELDVVRAKGEEDTQIPPFIVNSMIKICTKLSYASNFINYSFREDMISDALYDCVRFAKKFKYAIIKKSCETTDDYTCKVPGCVKRVNEPGCTRPGNPFSYLTTIAFSAFLRRIDAEKTQSYVKSKLIAETPIHDFFESLDTDDIELQENFVEFMSENSVNLINNEPMALKRKRKKALEESAKENEMSDVMKEIEDIVSENSLERFIDE